MYSEFTTELPLVTSDVIAAMFQISPLACDTALRDVSEDPSALKCRHDHSNRRELLTHMAYISPHH
jgi:hypothetical protein